MCLNGRCALTMWQPGVALFVVALVLASSAADRHEETIEELRDRIRVLEQRNEFLEQLHTANGSVTPALIESEEEQAIFAKIQVAKWPFASNFRQLSRKPTSFYIEVGAHNSDTLVDHLQEAFANDAFLIIFEPLLDKYADVLSRYGVEPNQWRGLGMQSPHSMVLPYAVGCRGTAHFHVTPADGCSSLLQPRGDDFVNDPRQGGWNEWMQHVCVREVDARWVPCVSLEHIIGDWLEGSDIEYLKVDTQGFDLAVVLSAGSHLEKLKSISLEVQCDYVAMLYAGAPNCTTVYKQMTQLGFETGFDPRFCRRCVETEIHFNRPGTRSPLDWLVSRDTQK